MLAVALACADPAADGSGAAPSPPSGSSIAPAEGILLISIDTLRADRLSAYGHVRRTSPAIDRMAREGVRFADVTAASSWTLPSHATMLLGLDPTRHGAVAFGADTVLPSAAETLAERFRAAGVRTAAFVGGGFVARRHGFDRGFETFSNLGPIYAFPGRLKSSVRHVRKWLRENGGERFFVFLHTYQVHMPYTPPPPYDRMFAPEVDGPPQRSLRFADLDTWGSGGARDAAFVRQASALYDAEIAYTDHLIGKLLGHLRRSGLARRMCVVLTSDHGEEFAEHGDLFHRRAKLHQELTAVPLLVWCPGRLAGGRAVAEPVGVVDVAPTLLELAGLPVPPDLDGVSLVPLLRGETPSGPRVIESDVDRSLEFLPGDDRKPPPGYVLALRAGRFKLLYDSVEGRRRLFDLSADPAERRDLADALPDVVAEFEPHLASAIARRDALPQRRADRGAAGEAELGEQLRALGYAR